MQWADNKVWVTIAAIIYLIGVSEFAIVSRLFVQPHVRNARNRWEGTAHGWMTGLLVGWWVGVALLVICTTANGGSAAAVPWWWRTRRGGDGLAGWRTRWWSRRGGPGLAAGVRGSAQRRMEWVSGLRNGNLPMRCRCLLTLHRCWFDARSMERQLDNHVMHIAAAFILLPLYLLSSPFLRFFSYCANSVLSDPKNFIVNSCLLNDWPRIQWLLIILSNTTGT